MDKYISKSDAVFAACRVLEKFGGCTMGPFCPDSGCKEVRDIIDQQPAADVKPVVRGTKIPHYTVEDWVTWCKCSVCGYDGLFEEDKFCSHCGAKLEE